MSLYLFAFAGLAPVAGSWRASSPSRAARALAFGLAGVAGLLAIPRAAYSLFSEPLRPARAQA